MQVLPLPFDPDMQDAKSEAADDQAEDSRGEGSDHLAGQAGEIALRQAAQGLVEAVQALPGVTCVHLGIARSEVSGVRTRETELRSAMAEKGFGAVLLVEGASRSGLEAALAEAKQLAIATGALTEPVIDVYETAFSITSEDMQAHNHAQAHQG